MSIDQARVERDGQLFRVYGPVDLASVPALHAECLPAAAAAGMTLDFANAGPVDSSALALLLDLRRAVQAAGGRFELRNPPPALHTLAALYGVDFLVDNRAPDA